MARMTLAQTSARAGMSQKTLERIESGERAADFAQVERLAEALGFSTSKLIQLAEQYIADHAEMPPIQSRKERADDERKAKTHRELIREGHIPPDAPAVDDESGELREHG